MTGSQATKVFGQCRVMLDRSVRRSIMFLSLLNTESDHTHSHTEPLLRDFVLFFLLAVGATFKTRPFQIQIRQLRLRVDLSEARTRKPTTSYSRNAFSGGGDMLSNNDDAGDVDPLTFRSSAQMPPNQRLRRRRRRRRYSPPPTPPPPPLVFPSPGKISSGRRLGGLERGESNSRSRRSRRRDRRRANIVQFTGFDTEFQSYVHPR